MGPRGWCCYMCQGDKSGLFTLKACPMLGLSWGGGSTLVRTNPPPLSTKQRLDLLEVRTCSNNLQETNHRRLKAAQLQLRLTWILMFLYIHMNPHNLFMIVFLFLIPLEVLCKAFYVRCSSCVRSMSTVVTFLFIARAISRWVPLVYLRTATVVLTKPSCQPNNRFDCALNKMSYAVAVRSMCAEKVNS